MDPRQYILQSALRHGVDPKVALSVWEQESGGSTDLELRGQTIQKGKWKGHWARGPWQIMTFHGEIPDSFEGQTDWAMKHLRERGVRGYYGEGEPGVAGHPTTDQYEAQVLARAGLPPIDARMASSDSELPPEMQTPGDPRTGRAQMNGSLPPELGDMPFGAQMYEQLMAEQEAQKPSFGERLAADPFFQMGAAILGAPGYGGNFMRAVGQGMSQGLQNAQAAEAARRETMHNQIRNRLWMEQLNNERFRLLGGEQPNAVELGQMEYQRGMVANKARENWLREQGLYEGGGNAGRVGTVSPDKYTPESVQKFAETGNYADLNQVEGKKPVKRDADFYRALASQRVVDNLAREAGVNLKDPKKDPVSEFDSIWSSGDASLLGRAGKGLRNTYAAITNEPGKYADTVRSYTKWRESFLGNLARSVGGETGVLSNFDIDRISKIFPAATGLTVPSKESVRKALLDVQAEVDRKIEEKIREAQGALPPEYGASPPESPEIESVTGGPGARTGGF